MAEPDRPDDSRTSVTGSLRQRWRYAFDQTIGSGVLPLMIWLAVVSVVTIAVAALLVTSFGITETGERPESYIEEFWDTMARAIDPVPVEAEGWGYRLVMLAVTVLGILIVSTLIGIVTSGIDSKLSDLRRGRSNVLETGHTLILGWSSKIAPILRELILANENQRRSTVVILAQQDKVEMEEEIAARVGDTGSTRVICRTGDPTDLDDLKIASPATARAVIVLSLNSGSRDADNVKVVLALKAVAKGPLPFHVVVAMEDATNVDAVRRIDPKVRVVQPEELIIRIMVQATVQPGLSSLYDELLSFAENEIYFQRDTTVEGLPFGQVVMEFDEASVIGIRSPDGAIELNPPEDRTIQKGDQLIAIALDDDRVVRSGQPPSVTLPTPPQTEQAHDPERVIVLGWHRWGPVLLKELDALLPAGSAVTILHDPDTGLDPAQGLPPDFSITVEVCHGVATDRGTLESLNLEQYDHAVVLSYPFVLGHDAADNRSLLTLIHLRDLCITNGLRLNVVSEILDVRNRALVVNTSQDDFIASEEIVSKIMVQLSENVELSGIFTTLLTAEGPEFHMRPVNNYVAPGTAVPFAAVVASSLKQGDIAVGYRKDDQITVNPKKSEVVALGEEDAVVVLAEE